jgi:hypothetical protein
VLVVGGIKSLWPITVDAIVLQFLFLASGISDGFYDLQCA